MLIKNLDETLVNGSIGKITEFCEPQDFTLNPADAPIKEEKPSSKPVSKAGGSAGIGQKWPVVEFIVRQGSHMGTRRMLMQPETWKVEIPNGEVQVSRTQVCIEHIVAWHTHSNRCIKNSCLSYCHGPCQSTSLKDKHLSAAKWTWVGSSRRVSPAPLAIRVISDTSLLPGQAYVALSRATSLDGLQVLNFDPLKVCSFMLCYSCGH